MIETRIVGPEDSIWAEAMPVVRHDVHHLPGWAVATAPLEGGTPAAVVAESRRARSSGRALLLAPFVRRELDGGRWDAISPYGYAGPALSGPAGAVGAFDLLAAAADRLAAAGAVSWFLRLHPMLDGWAAGHPAVRTHGEVVVLDLGPDADAFERDLRRDHRSDLRRAARDGLTARSGVAGPDDLATFATLYAETMSRRGASAYHRFATDHFAALAAGLEDGLCLVEVLAAERVVAAALFTFAPESRIAGYHLAATVPDPPRGATKLVIAEGRRTAREHGLAHLMLGGGLGSAEDALFMFKAGFGGARHRFRTLRLVLDSTEHDARCARAGVDPASEGYFPAYRAPAAAALGAS